MEKIKTFFKWVGSCISPVYIMMLVAAFVLWFITKLGDTYVTDHNVTVIIDDVEYDVACKIKGKGTDLVHYTTFSENSRVVIPFSDLSFETPMVDNQGHSVKHVTAESMKQALAQRMDNIEVVSVGSVPIISENYEEGETIIVE